MSKQISNSITNRSGKSRFSYDGNRIVLTKADSLDDTLSTFVDTVNALSALGNSTTSEAFGSLEADELAADSLSSSNLNAGSIESSDVNIDNSLNVGLISVSNNVISSPGTDMILRPGSGLKVSVEGNMDVKGELTRVRTVETVLQDPVIALGYYDADEDDFPTDNYDRGSSLTWTSGQNVYTGFMGYSRDKDRFVFLKDADADDSGNIFTRKDSVVNTFELDRLYTNKIMTPDYTTVDGNNLAITVGGAMSQDISGNRTITVDGVSGETVGGTYTVSSSGDFLARSSAGSLTVSTSDSTNGNIIVSAENTGSIIGKRGLTLSTEESALADLALNSAKDLNLTAAVNGSFTTTAGDLTMTTNNLRLVTSDIFTDTQATNLNIIDNSASSLIIQEGSNPYLTLHTTNSGEKIQLHQNLDFDASIIDLETQPTELKLNQGSTTSLKITDNSADLLVFDTDTEKLILNYDLDFNASEIDLSTQDVNMSLIDNSASSLTIKEGNNNYLTIHTTDGGEKFQIHQDLDIDASEIDLSTQDVNMTIIDNSATALTLKEGSINYLTVHTTDGGEKFQIHQDLDIDASEIDLSTQATNLTIIDNSSTALTLKEGVTDYLTVHTTDGGEKFQIYQDLDFDADIIDLETQDTEIKLRQDSATSLTFADNGTAFLVFDTDTEKLILNNDLDFNASEIDLSTQDVNMTIIDNSATALTLKEGNNNYLTVHTTDGGEKFQIHQNLDFDASEIDLSTQDVNMTIIDNSGTALTLKEGSNNYLTVHTTDGGEKFQIHQDIDFDASEIDLSTQDVNMTIIDNSATALTLKEGNNNYLTVHTTDGGEKFQIHQNLDIDASEIDLSTQATNLTIIDNSATALTLKEGSNTYLTIHTTNNTEKFQLHHDLDFDASVIDLETQNTEIKLAQGSTTSLSFTDNTANFMVFDTSNEQLILNNDLDFNADIINLETQDTEIKLAQGSTTSLSFTDNGTSMVVLDTSGEKIVLNNELDFNASEIDLSSQATNFTIIDNSATALTLKEGSTNYLTVHTTNDAEKFQIHQDLDIDASEIDLSSQNTNFSIIDNSASSLTIKEGSNSYVTIHTTDDAEKIQIHHDLDFDSDIINLETQDTEIKLAQGSATSLSFTDNGTSMVVLDTSGEKIVLNNELDFNASEIDLSTQATNLTIIDNSATALTLKEGSTNYLTVHTTNNAEKFQIHQDLDIDASEIDLSTQATNLTIIDNSATALTLKEGSTNYLTIHTTNDAEKFQIHQDLDIDASEIDLSSQNTNFSIIDNSASSLTIKEGSNSYVTIHTTDDAEKIQVHHDLDFDADVINLETQNTEIKLAQSSATSLSFTDNGSNIMVFDTSNEKLVLNNDLDFNSSTIDLETQDTEVKLAQGSTTSLSFTDNGTSMIVLDTSGEKIVLNNELDINTSEIDLSTQATNLTIIDNSATALTLKEGSTNYLTVHTTNDAEKFQIHQDLDIDASEIDLSTQATNMSIIDNSATALTIKEGSTNYLTVHTTNDSEKIQVHQDLDFDSDIINLETQDTEVKLAQGSITSLSFTDNGTSMIVLDTSGEKIVLNNELDINTSEVDLSTQATNLTIIDNSATALTLKEGSTDYLTVHTTNGGEKFQIHQDLDFDSGAIDLETQDTEVKLAQGSATSLSFTDNGTSMVVLDTSNDKIVLNNELDINTGEIDLSTQATNLTIIDNSATALTLKEGSTNYLTVHTTNGGEKFQIHQDIDFDASEIDLATQDTNLTIIDNSATALTLKEGGNSYLTVHTTNGGEKFQIHQDLDVDASEIDLSTQATNLTIIDNSATALTIKEGSNSYITLHTTNDGEKIQFHHDIDFDADIINLETQDTEVKLAQGSATSLSFTDNGTSMIVLDTSGEKIVLNNELDFNASEIDLSTQATNLTIIDDSATALTLKEGSTNYLTVHTTNGGEKFQIHQDLDIDASEIDLSSQATNMSIIDNSGSALTIKEGSNSYVTLHTTNDGEKIQLHQDLDIDASEIDLSSQATNISLIDNSGTALTIKEGSNTYLTINTTDSSESMTITKPTSLTDSTASTSTSTGALIVTGGVGVGDAVYIGGLLDVSGNLLVDGGTVDLSASATNMSIIDNSNAALTIKEGSNSYLTLHTTNSGEKIQLHQDLDIDASEIDLSTQATNISLIDNSGTALTIKEGSNTYLTINTTDSSESLTITKPTTVSDSTASTSTSSGALIVSGGVGIGGGTYIGGVINIAGSTTLGQIAADIDMNNFTMNNYGNANYTHLGAGAGNTSSAIQTTAIGSGALGSLTTGTNNTALGYNAGNALTEGSDHVLVGRQAGSSLTTQDGSTMIGHNAGESATGTSMTLLGKNAGENASGSYSIFIGHSAGQNGVANQNGSVGIGYRALQNLGTGSQNTVIGHQTGMGITTGGSNTLLGFGSGQYLTEGSNNTFIGTASGDTVTTGSNNIFIGYGVDGTTSSASLFRVGVSDYHLFSGDMANHNLTVNADLTISSSADNSSGHLNVDGDTTLSGTLDILDATASTSTSTGSVTLSGGLGVTGAISASKILIDDDRSGTPSLEGSYLHLDTNTYTDDNTSTAGTAGDYAQVSLEGITLAATNADVTTPNATTLYLKNAPSAGTNETILNSYALWVDDGNVRFDGDLDLSFETTNLAITDNSSTALTIKEGSNNYLTLNTTNSSEAITLHQTTTVSDTTAASSTTTGSLVVSGGVGIGGAAYIGGLLDVTGNLLVDGGTMDLSASATNMSIIDNSSAALTIKEGSNDYLTIHTTNLGEKIQLHQDLDIDASEIDLSTQATNMSIIDNSSTALTIKEGSNTYLTIDTTNSSESITITKPTTLSDSTTSSSTTTGALIVSGGVGISDAVYVGGLLDVTGNLLVDGGTVDLSATATDMSIIDNSSTALTIKEGSNEYLTLHTTNDGEKIQLHQDLDIDASEIDFSTQATNFGIVDNSSTALTIKEGSNNYLTLNTTDSSEAITLHQATTVSDTTAASSTTTGALIVSGGVGIGDAVYVGGLLDVTGNLLVDGGTVDLSASATNMSIIDNSSTALTIKEGSNDYLTIHTTNSGEKIQLHQDLDIDASEIDLSTQATNMSIIDNSGTALTIKEGSNTYLTIDTTNSSEAITITKPTTLSDSTASSSTTTGALIVTGGVGIGGAMSIGGNIDMNNNMIGNYGTSTHLFLGVSAGNGATGDNNIGIGPSVLASLTTGTNNTAMGYLALTALTEGAGNTALGSHSGEAITTAVNNTLIGMSTGRDLTEGDFNTVLGMNACYSMTTGERNTLVGYSAGTNATGSRAVVLGMSAGENFSGTNGLVAIGYTAGRNVSSGVNNIMIGNETGDTVTTGSSNILIGKGVDGATTQASTLRIGLDSYHILDGDMANHDLTVNADLTISSSADNSSGNLNVDGATTLTGALDVNDSTASSSTSTGAVTVTGGVGIGGAVYVGGLLDVTGNLLVDGGTVDLSASATNMSIIDNSSTALTIKEGSNDYLTLHTTNSGEKIQLHQDLDIDASEIDLSTQATNMSIIDNSSTALTIKEGSNTYLTINTTNSSEAITLTKSTTISDSTASSSTTTGALIVTGGVGINGAVNIGGALDVGGALSFDSLTVASDIDMSNNMLTNYGNANYMFLGVGSGNSATGDYNTGLGASSLAALTSGTNNTAVGQNAGLAITEAKHSTLVGYNAGAALTTQDNNTIVGQNAAISATASGVTVIGKGAAQSITGLNQVWIGRDAGELATAGSTGIIGIGYHALRNLTDGSDNVVIGYNSGNAVTTGSYNVMLGFHAGNGITTSSANTLIGHRAGAAVSGTSNTLIGYEAGDSVSSGGYNTMIGYQTGDSVTSGSNNIMIGKGVDGATTQASTLRIGLDSYYAIDADMANHNMTIDADLTISSSAANSSGNLNVDGATTLTGALDVNDSTASTSTSTGAVIVSGGAGIGGAVYVGGLLDVTGNLLVDGGTVDLSATATNMSIIDNSSTALTIKEGSNDYLTLHTTNSGEKIQLHQDLDIDASEIDLSTQAINMSIIDNSSTALTIKEGSNTYLTIDTTNSSEAITLTKSTTISDSTTSSSTSTGALIVTGGVGIGGAVNVGGALDVGGDLSFSSMTVGGNIDMSNNMLGNYGTSTYAFLGVSSGNGATGDNNVAFGPSTMASLTTGNNNAAFGFSALTSATEAIGNTAIGPYSGEAITTGGNNTLVGMSSGRDLTTGSYNVVVGMNSCYYMTTGERNTLVGYGSSSNATGSRAVVMGYDAGSYFTGTNGLVAIGYSAGRNVNSGTYNTMIGYETGDSVTIGSNNILIGKGVDGATSQASTLRIGLDTYYAIDADMANHNMTIDADLTISSSATNSSGNLNVDGATTLTGALDVNDSTASSSTSTGAVTITGGLGVGGAVYVGGALNVTGDTTLGTLAADLDLNNNSITNYGHANYTHLGAGAGNGSSATQTTALGPSALAALTTGTHNTAVGYAAGTAITEGASNTLLGRNAGNSLTTQDETTMIGHNAGESATGTAITLLGKDAGLNASGSYSVFIGHSAAGTGVANQNGTIGIGYQTLQNLSTGTQNVAIGHRSGQGVTTGATNTLVGYMAGFSMTEGSSNTLLGNAAGDSITTGSNNIFIGKGVDGSSSSASLFRLGLDDYYLFAGDMANHNLTINADLTISSSADNSSGNLNVDGATTLTGALDVNDSTASSSTSTGAVIVTGGVGIGGAVNIGGALDVGGALSFDSLTVGGNIDMSNNMLGNYGTSTYLFLGASAGNGATGDNNIGVGPSVMAALTTGTNNTGMGYHSLTALTEGNGNSSFGSHSGEAITTAVNNTLIGMSTGRDLTSGSYNTFLGMNSGYVMTTGERNSVVGYGAGFSATGSRAAVLGMSAGVKFTGTNGLVAIGYQAAGNVTSGTDNIMIGQDTGDTVTTGSNNILIGKGVDGATTQASTLRIGLDSYHAIDADMANHNMTIDADLTISSSAANSSGNLNVDGTTTLTGVLDVNDSTASSSSSTGAVIVSGGVGIGGAAYIGGLLDVTGNILIDGGTVDLSASATNMSIIDNSSTALTIKEGSNNYLTLHTTNSGEKIQLHQNLDIDTSEIDLSTQATNLSILDNSSTALTIKEGSNTYLTLDTTDSSEAITLHKNTTFSGNATLTAGDLTMTGQQIINTQNSNTYTIGDTSEDNLKISHTYLGSDNTEYTYTTGTSGQGINNSASSHFGVAAIVGSDPAFGYAPIAGITFKKMKWYLSKSGTGTITITCYYNIGQAGQQQLGDPIEVDLDSAASNFDITFTHSSNLTVTPSYDSGGGNVYDYFWLKTDRAAFDVSGKFGTYVSRMGLIQSNFSGASTTGTAHFDLISQPTSSVTVGEVISSSGNFSLENDLVVKGDLDLSDSATNIALLDNSSTALTIKEGSNDYLTINTTNSSEAITVAKATTFSDSTTSSSASTGAVIVTGGVGIGGALNVTGTATVGGLSITGSLDIDNIVFESAYAHVGVGSGNSSTANYNVSYGASALAALTTGTGNVAMGYQTGLALTEADENVLIGTNTGRAITTGGYNTAVGVNALYSLVTGTHNTIMGHSAGINATGSHATALGYNSGRNHTGTGLTALGYSAGQEVTSGNYNTMIGYQAGDTITTGSNNIMIGKGVDGATTQASTLRIGLDSYYAIDADMVNHNLTLNSDVTISSSAANSSGNLIVNGTLDVTAIDANTDLTMTFNDGGRVIFDEDHASGYNSAAGATTMIMEPRTSAHHGGSIIQMKYDYTGTEYEGFRIISELGHFNERTRPDVTFEQHLDGGGWTKTMKFNSLGPVVEFGAEVQVNSGFGLTLLSDDAVKPTTNTWTISSDVRLKENIADISRDDALEAINQIKIRSFNYTKAFREKYQLEDMAKIGVVAQELEEIPLLSPCVQTKSDEIFYEEAEVYEEDLDRTVTKQVEVDRIENRKQVNMDRVNYLLIAAVQKLTDQVESLTQKLQAAEDRITELEK